jgi:hypothetical protein
LEDKITQNMKSAKLYMTLGNTLAAICFLIAFFVTDNIWFLVAALLLFAAGAAGYIVFNKVEEKFQAMAAPTDKTDND